MKADFVNIPEKDLHGPETESQEFYEEVRREVESPKDERKDKKQEREAAQPVG
ncbi:hypothetical protein TSACC_21531 [Terrimicrobium sacchariphilum]|jgi:hypothetical protein|uniref:Uncharacterized protein n=1 Tax=Terrimicrobium sacchariphilum TaxID=690879 RepID=A0A146G6W5_TERSA|nr:hypothetical protein [Terrimicrobium sacchariphilum]GAT33122.1 hypothetical protein TSACC_21531 [Terrimicrobium sacchariphilum]